MYMEDRGMDTQLQSYVNNNSMNRYTNEQVYGPQSIVPQMSQYICPN